MVFKIYVLPKYDEWFQSQTEKSKVQIENRLDRIKQDGHFGHIRDLGDNLFELKFNDGRRIYYTIIPVNNIILLLGGNKNGQDNDIRKAKNSLQKAKENAKKRIIIKS
jgi:putative addiction module killer protein